jgi:flagellar hook-associated protein 1 FlgK
MSRALDAQQTALNVTGQNVANASTVGYTRQTANFQQTPSQSVILGGASISVGTGVSVNSITRARDSYLDGQYREQTSIQQYWGEQETALQNLQGVVNEPSDTALSGDMTNFFNAWSDLANDPQDMGARSVVEQQALTLTDNFHNMAQQISSLQTSADNNVQNEIHQINEYASQIQSLNKQIQTQQAVGVTPNDLLDQRDNIVDELSKIVNVTVTEQPNSSDSMLTDYSVAIGGDPSKGIAPQMLVSNSVVNTLVDPIANSASATLATGQTVSSSSTSATINPGDEFQIFAGGKTTTITVKTGDTLQSIADTINGASAGVTASLNASGQLTIADNSTGVDNAATFTDVNGTSALEDLGIVGSGLQSTVQSVPSADAATTLAGGKISISGGTISPLNITVTNQESLASIASSINGSNAGVTASVAKVSGGYQLSIAGTGLTVTDNSGLGMASSTTNVLNVTQAAQDGVTVPTWATGPNAGQVLTLGDQMGTLGADINMRDTYLPNFMNQLNTLAQGVASAVNALQRTGQGLTAESQLTSSDTPVGIDFFTTAANSSDAYTTPVGLPTGITAANITLNQAISDNISRIATGQLTPQAQIVSSAVQSGVMQAQTVMSNVQSVDSSTSPTNVPAGSFTINVGGTPTTINVTANESLQGIADAINKVPSVSVTASVVQNSAGGYQLSITNNSTGVDNAVAATFTDGTGSPLSALGILGNGFQSDSSVSSGLANAEAPTSVTGGTLAFTLGSSSPVTISVTPNESLTDIAKTINTANIGVTASVAKVGATSSGNNYQLTINNNPGVTAALTITDDTGLGITQAASKVPTVTQPAQDGDFLTASSPTAATTNVPQGSFSITVGGKTAPISVAANESLQGIADSINNSAVSSGVSASVQQVNGGYQLVITNTKTGIDNTATFTDGTGTGGSGYPLKALGIMTEGFQSAISGGITNADSAASMNGTLTFNFGSGSSKSISVNPNESLADIAEAINTANFGVTASVSNSGSGYQLTINNNPGVTDLLSSVDNGTTGLGIAAAASPVPTVTQAAQDESTKVNAGDGSVALAIASLGQGWTSLQSQIQSGEFGTVGTDPVSATSFADYYSASISQLGTDAQEATQMKSNQDTLVNQVSNQRQSVSGVSLDEEMTNMIQYQTAYSAAARMVTMMDSLLSTITSGMGTTR